MALTSYAKALDLPWYRHTLLSNTTHLQAAPRAPICLGLSKTFFLSSAALDKNM